MSSNPLKLPKAIKALVGNSEKLAKAPKLLNDVINLAKEMGTDIPNFVSYINSPEG